jgi:hypothetical protein
MPKYKVCTIGKHKGIETKYPREVIEYAISKKAAIKFAKKWQKNNKNSAFKKIVVLKEKKIFSLLMASKVCKFGKINAKKIRFLKNNG